MWHGLITGINIRFCILTLWQVITKKCLLSVETLVSYKQCNYWLWYISLGSADGAATTYQVKQLEQQNERIKEALVKSVTRIFICHLALLYGEFTVAVLNTRFCGNSELKLLFYWYW